MSRWIWTKDGILSADNLEIAEVLHQESTLEGRVAKLRAMLKEVEENLEPHYEWYTANKEELDKLEPEEWFSQEWFDLDHRHYKLSRALEAIQQADEEKMSLLMKGSDEAFN